MLIILMYLHPLFLLINYILFIEMNYVYIYMFFPVEIQSLNDLGRLTYRRFLELFRHMVGLLGSDQPVARPLPTQDNTTQKDADKHPCLDSEIRTHDPSDQPAKTHASDSTATVTGDHN
jgi:hypothetical protein